MKRRTQSLKPHTEESSRAEAEEEIYTNRSLSEKGAGGDGASGGPMWDRASYVCINELAVSACFFPLFSAHGLFNCVQICIPGHVFIHGS